MINFAGKDTNKRAKCQILFEYLRAGVSSMELNLRKMIKTLLITVLIVAICVALLSVKLIFRKDGRFESQHIHDSKAMRDRGIHCVIDQDREARASGKAY